ncbi:unnamed protein product [Cunninghamella blakesleeana]
MKYTVLLSILSLSSIVSSELTKVRLEYRATDDTKLYREGVFNDDGVFYGRINIGGQTIPMTFDTSSPINWVPSSKCQTSSCNLVSKKYDASKSSTAVNTHRRFKVIYDDGCIDGTLYEDKINIAGYPINNATFINANKVTGDLGTNNYLGTLGFGGFDEGDWYNNPNGEITVSINDTLKAGNNSPNKLARRGFSYAPQMGFSPAPGAPGRRKLRKRWYDSYFVIGGIDYDLVDGDFVQLDLPTCDYGDSKYWKSELSYIKLGDQYEKQIKTKTKTLAQFNSLTKYIIAPEETSKCLHEAIHAKLTHNQHGDKVYQLPCDQADALPNLEFKLNNQYKASIPNSAWFEQDEVNPTMCNSLIRSICNDGDKSKDQNWVLGNAFLNEFYVYLDFHQGTISMAKPKGRADTEVGPWN